MLRKLSRKSRWLQFSLRALLLAMTATAVWLGILPYEFRRIAQVEAAVNEFESIGGRAYIGERPTIASRIAYYTSPVRNELFGYELTAASFHKLEEPLDLAILARAPHLDNIGIGTTL